MSREFEKWIGLRRPAQDRQACMIALSHAGGGASAYRNLAKDLAHEEWLDFVAIQLPGRERRAAEPPFCELESLLHELESVIAPLTDVPYVLLGYSMGAILAYELAAKLLASGKRPPEQVILAAQMAPDPSFRRRERYALPREAFIQELQKLGGTDRAILENEKFMELFLKTLRADFEIVDRYLGTKREPIPCPFFVLGSIDDPEVSVEQLLAWSRYTSAGFDSRLFAGGHFFLHSEHGAVMDAINAFLRNFLLRNEVRQ